MLVLNDPPATAPSARMIPARPCGLPGLRTTADAAANPMPPLGAKGSSDTTGAALGAAAENPANSLASTGATPG